MKRKYNIFKRMTTVSLITFEHSAFKHFRFQLFTLFLLFFSFGVHAQIAWPGTSGSITLSGGTTYSNVTLTGDITIYVASGDATVSGVISAQDNNYTVTKTGNGSLYFTGNNTYLGTTTISEGSLYIGNSSPGGSVAGDIINNASLIFSRYSEYTYSGIISGTGSIRKMGGSNKLILTGENTYTGGTTVQTGILQIGNNTVPPYATGSINNTVGVLVNSNAYLRFELSAPNNFSKVISGDGGVEYKGISSCPLTLSADNTYSGLTYIDGGTLYIGNNTTTGAIIGNIINWGSLIFYRSNEYTHMGAISGNGSVTKDGSGKTILTKANDYDGTTNIITGTLALGAAGSLLNSSEVILSGANAKLDITAGDKTIKKLSSSQENAEVILGTRTLTIGTSSGTDTFRGFISGTGNIIKQGDGTLVLTGNNTYTGTTTISSGTLQIGNSSNDGAIASNIINNGALIFSQPNGYTYSGIISGTGTVTHQGNLPLYFTGNNTYTGVTTALNGVLYIGNSTPTGAVAGNIVSNREIYFYRSNDYTYTGDISGICTVTKRGSGDLYFTGNNTYSEHTLIENGNLYIGNNSTSGSIAGNIVNYGNLYFNRSDEYTFSGIISGLGIVYKQGSGKTILNGINTYTGSTEIYGGTLKLGINGSIENSDYLYMEGMVKFDVSAGDKKICSLGFGDSESEIILGSQTLTIGTLDEDNSDGAFGGKFTGTGNVIKTGTGSFTITGDNLATGTFTHEQGKVIFGSKWNGDYYKEMDTEMEIQGSTDISGSFTITGGDINMDLTTDPPSSLVVSGQMDISGTNTLNIISGVQDKYLLFQADSGITETSCFEVNMNMPSFLEATGTTLLLSADDTPPTPGGNGTIEGNGLVDKAFLSWEAASDNLTPPDELKYFVYQSLYNNISTVEDCEENGTLLNAGGAQNLTSYTASGLIAGTTYYFNVVVTDKVLLKAAYTVQSVFIEEVYLVGSVTISGNAVYGETLTADTNDLTSEPITNLGELTYQWKRGETIIGTNNKTYTIVQADIDNTITVTVTAANCNGSITSDPTPDIQKAEQEAPDAPELDIKSSVMIKLVEISDCEYRMDGGNWQTSSVFTDLKSATAYEFQARKTETNTHKPSLPGSSVIIFTNCIITASVEGENGTIDPVGDIEIEYGEDQTFTIIPDEYYQIDQILVDGEIISLSGGGQEEDYTFLNVTANHTISASFKKESYTVTLRSSNEEWGSVSGGGTFEYETEITVTAKANEGYEFVNWTNSANNNIISLLSDYSFTVIENIDLTANFKTIGKFSVNINIEPENAGFVEGAGYYNSGDIVVVKATPNEGFIFYFWTKDGINETTNSEFSFTITDNTTLTAHFKHITYTVSASVNIEDAGIVEGARTYNYGEEATLTATPNDGFVFRYWTNSKGTQLSTNAIYKFTVKEDVAVIANFRHPDNYLVIIGINPEGAGTFTGDGEYERDIYVTVTATPNAKYNFVEWTKNGVQVSPNETYTFKITADVILIANFELKTGSGEIENIEITGAQLSPPFDADIHLYRLLFNCGQNNATIQITPKDPEAVVISDDTLLDNGKLNVSMTTPGSGDFKIISVNEIDYAFELIRPFDNAVIRVWNDVYSVINNPVYNGGYSFTEYQWYSDNLLINKLEGETKGNFQVTEGETNQNTNYTVWLVGYKTDGQMDVASFGCVSTITASNIELKVWPNPAREIVTVEVENNPAEFLVELRNIQGIIVKKIIITQPLFEIEINDLPTGIYLMTVDGVTVRVVKE